MQLRYAGKMMCPFLVTGLLVVFAADAAATQEGVDALSERVTGIALGLGGQVGIAIEHLETRRSVTHNGDVLFPLASVYKVPIMVAAFRQVEAGTLSLDERIEVTAENWMPWGPTLSPFDLGLKPSVRDLIFWMMTVSDNMATDILLARVGADNVNRTLRALGIDDLRVDRPVEQLVFDYAGLPGGDTPDRDIAALREAHSLAGAFLAERSRETGHQPLPPSVIAYNRDPRDTGTPLAMNALLIRIQQGEAVTPKYDSIMMDIMYQSRTGGDRIRGLLPRGTAVAQKTGTWPTSVNNAGIIQLPNGKGHVVISVFTNDMNEPTDDVAAMIARIARAAYDFFMR